MGLGSCLHRIRRMYVSPDLPYPRSSAFLRTKLREEILEPADEGRDGVGYYSRDDYSRGLTTFIPPKLMKAKFCCHCKWETGPYLCQHPYGRIILGYDPVRGILRYQTERLSCDDARKAGGVCGPEGKLFKRGFSGYLAYFSLPTIGPKGTKI